MTLSQIEVTDTVTVEGGNPVTRPATPVACPETTLAPGESFTCSADGTPIAGQYENTGAVTGTSAAGVTVTDFDLSHYIGVEPGIDIEKATNGEDADLAPGPFLKPGDAVTWTYVVKNTGQVPLTSVNVTDDQGVIPVYQSGDSNTDGILDTAETWTYTAMAVGGAKAGQYENTATATGLAGSVPVADSDASHYFGAKPSVDVEKATNGEDADLPADAPLVPVGADLWCGLTASPTPATYLSPIGSPPTTRSGTLWLPANPAAATRSKLVLPRLRRGRPRPLREHRRGSAPRR